MRLGKPVAGFYVDRLLMLLIVFFDMIWLFLKLNVWRLLNHVCRSFPCLFQFIGLKDDFAFHEMATTGTSIAGFGVT